MPEFTIQKLTRDELKKIEEMNPITLFNVRLYDRHEQQIGEHTFPKLREALNWKDKYLYGGQPFTRAVLRTLDARLQDWVILSLEDNPAFAGPEDEDDVAAEYWELFLYDMSDRLMRRRRYPVPDPAAITREIRECNCAYSSLTYHEDGTPEGYLLFCDILVNPHFVLYVDDAIPGGPLSDSQLREMMKRLAVRDPGGVDATPYLD